MLWVLFFFFFFWIFLIFLYNFVVVLVEVRVVLMDAFRWVQSCLPFVVLCVSESRSQKEVCGMQDRCTYWLYTSIGTGWYFNRKQNKNILTTKGYKMTAFWCDFSAKMPFSRQGAVILIETNEKAWMTFSVCVVRDFMVSRCRVSLQMKQFVSGKALVLSVNPRASVTGVCDRCE